jgi:hypothetical protein
MYPNLDIITLSCGESAIFDSVRGFGYICSSCGIKLKGNTYDCEENTKELIHPNHGRLDNNS